MEYETSDGSEFSLREVWTERYGHHTSVSAFVNGEAYTGKLQQLRNEINEEDVLDSLEPVPKKCVCPLFPEGFIVAPEHAISSERYLKRPSFTYEDCRLGTTLVADCVLNEASVLEFLETHPHPHIGSYFGCRVTTDGRITHLCLKRYQSSLSEYAESGLSEAQVVRLVGGIKGGIEHLHSLGLAHNDITPDNICVDSTGEAVIVDFDSCIPFGERLTKGAGSNSRTSRDAPVSSKENDSRGLDDIASSLSAPNQ